MKKLKKEKKQFDNFIKYSGIGMQMLIIIAAGVFGGYKLDKWLDNQFPILLIILSTLAMITAIYHAIKDFI
ncbi:MAG TPA: AtpZ/AtpI family protein [Bacteroidales bacterium]|nr:AtpZ/AtpI family protein [Bacteroidales bacterium]